MKHTYYSCYTYPNTRSCNKALVALMPLDQHLSAVPRAVTRVRKASRVLEGLDTVEHNEARRVRRTKMKPVVPSTCEALREATEVASLPPPPIRVAAGSAQVRLRPQTHIIDMAASSGF